MGHITVEQSYQIQTLKAAGNNQREIAEIIGRSKSVISGNLAATVWLTANTSHR